MSQALISPALPEAVPQPVMPPAELRELSRGERLLLAAFRHWVVGLSRHDHRHWAAAWDELAGALGGAPAKPVLEALTGLIRVICERARRPLQHHQPCCPCIAADEAALLSLVIDRQRGRGEAAAARALWLVSREGVAPLAAAAGKLAEALAEAGILFPDRTAPLAPGERSCGPVAL